jgi:hypothetical protein
MLAEDVDRFNVSGRDRLDQPGRRAQHVSAKIGERQTAADKAPVVDLGRSRTAGTCCAVSGSLQRMRQRCTPLPLTVIMCANR